MLFDIKQFEQFFKENVLKKGLKLFERGELELVERHSGSEYHFSIREADLHLKKRGDKLLHYTCSCKHKDYCEHLSAVLFYLQQETLGIRAKHKITELSKGTLKRSPETTYTALKKLEMEGLLRFVKDRGDRIPVAEVRAYVRGKSTTGIADVYSMQIHIVLEPYLALKKLDEKQIKELTGKMQHAISGIKKQLRKGAEQLYLCFAVIQAYIPLFSMRFTGDEKGLFAPYYAMLENLDQLYEKGLSPLQENEWFRATLLSVETNKNLESGAFLFLLPRFVAATKKQAGLSLLSKILEKRTYKVPYSQAFDKLLIARMEVALREQQLSGAALPVYYKAHEMELIVARAELELCSGNIKKAFVLLDSGYSRVKTTNKNYYNDFIAYSILNAAKHDKRDIELYYLRESFIHGLFILPDYLERFLRLIPKSEQIQEIEKLIKDIRHGSKAFYFDKVSALLLRLNLLDQLILELARQEDKFSLVHTIALKKYPVCNNQLLALYIKHLAEALKQDSAYNHQVKVFNTARVFLNKLPEDVLRDCIKKLLYQIGKVGSIYRYIVQLYGHLLEDEF